MFICEQILNNGNTYIRSYINLSPRLLKYLNENALRKNKMLISLVIFKYNFENNTKVG